MGCRNRHPVNVRIFLYDTQEVRVIPKSVAERMIYHELGMRIEDWEELKKKGQTMKVKILRNGKICDMPDKNAQAYIKTGQAVAVETKALSKPAANKKIEKAPETKTTEFVCEKCGKVYKTAAGFKKHKCK